MSTPITLPNLGESITEGTVTQWLKREGDSVEVDEPLLEVATDKVDTEIPSPSSGVLTKILVDEDETVEVGSEIAMIGTTAESESAPAATPEPDQQQPAPEPEPAPAEAAQEQQPAAPEPQPREQPAQQQPAQQQPAQQQPAQQEPAQQQPAQPAAAPSTTSTSATSTQAMSAPAVDVGMVSGTSPGTDTGGKPEGTADEGASEAYVTPLVRKLAAEQGVDLDSVTGTGVGGRIRKQDVLAAAQSQARPQQETAPTTAQAAPVRPSSAAADTSLRGRTEPMTRLRQTIAEGMVESQQVAAQQTQVVEVDVTRIDQLRERARNDFEAREGTRMSYFPFFALATVEALKQHPKLNAVIDGEKKEVTYHAVENLGITVDTDRGLLASVIKDAGDLNLGGLARKISDLAVRTRSGDLSPEELSGGTFTLTNIGRVGALFETPIINQPQVGILSVGDVVKRPVVLEDPRLGEVIAVRSMVHLALSYDQRLVDGDDAARFLGTVRERLEDDGFDSEVGLA